MAPTGGSGNLTLPAMLVALITTGVVVGTSYDQQGDRPGTGGPHTDFHHEPGKVEAQLWEAPLLAVQRKLNCPASTKPLSIGNLGNKSNDCDIAADTVWNNRGNNSRSPGELMILPIIINDSPSTMREERERRDRYALVTALIDRGLIPVDSAHLKYYAHNLDSKPSQPSCTGESNAATRSSVSARTNSAVHIPYEWYLYDKKQVLVLWLAKSWLDKDPTGSLYQILSTLTLTLSPSLTNANCKSSVKAAGETQSQCPMGSESTTVSILGLGGTGSIKKTMQLLEAKLPGSEDEKSNKVSGEKAGIKT